MSNILKALKHTFTVGETAHTFSDNSITDETIIDVYFTKDIPYEISQTNNTVTVEISALSYAVGCAIVINNVDSVDYPITAENVSYFSHTVEDELLEHRSELNGLTNAIGLLDTEKQDKLISGTNITIEDNVISASGGGSLSFNNNTSSTVVAYIEDGQDKNYTIVDSGYYYACMFGANANGQMQFKIGDCNILSLGSLTGVHPCVLGVYKIEENTNVFIRGNYCYLYKIESV